MNPFRVVAGVRGIVARTGLTLASEPGTARWVWYSEAAVGDRRARGYSPGEMSMMIAPVGSIEIHAAGALVPSAIDGWVAAGMLERA